MAVLSRSLLGALALVGFAGAAQATVYTSDPNSSDLTAGITNYAALSNYSAGPPAPFTPTSVELNTIAARVFGGGSLPNLGNDQILATFSSPVSRSGYSRTKTISGQPMTAISIRYLVATIEAPGRRCSTRSR